MLIADDVVTLASPPGLEFVVLDAIWEEGFIPQPELRG